MVATGLYVLGTAAILIFGPVLVGVVGGLSNNLGITAQGTGNSVLITAIANLGLVLAGILEVLATIAPILVIAFLAYQFFSMYGLTKKKKNVKVTYSFVDKRRV